MRSICVRNTPKCKTTMFISLDCRLEAFDCSIMIKTPQIHKPTINPLLCFRRWSSNCFVILPNIKIFFHSSAIIIIPIKTNNLTKFRYIHKITIKKYIMSNIIQFFKGRCLNYFITIYCYCPFIGCLPWNNHKFIWVFSVLDFGMYLPVYFHCFTNLYDFDCTPISFCTYYILFA